MSFEDLSQKKSPFLKNTITETKPENSNLRSGRQQIMPAEVTQITLDDIPISELFLSKKKGVRGLKVKKHHIQEPSSL